MKKIKFGVVGAGSIARKFLEDIKVVSNAKVVAIASRDFNKANSYKEEFNLDYAFGSYLEMAESNVIDAVYIATPHNFHEEQSILFAKHKKHVLCEKPIAVNAIQAENMFKVANENNVLLMEAMWTRFLPSAKRIKSITDNKEFGDIKEIELSFCVPIGIGAPEVGRLLNPNLAGGSLLDVGIYPMTYLLYLMDAPIGQIEAQSEFHVTGVDLYTEVDIEFDNALKTQAKLMSGFDRDSHNQAIITYENGFVVVPEFYRGEKIFVNDLKEFYPFKAGGFEYQIESFANTILAGNTENDIMTKEVSLEVMRLSDAIRKKIKLIYPFE